MDSKCQRFAGHADMVEQQPGGWEQQTVDFEPGSQGARIPTKNWKVLVTEVLFT